MPGTKSDFRQAGQKFASRCSAPCSRRSRRCVCTPSLPAARSALSPLTSPPTFESWQAAIRSSARVSSLQPLELAESPQLDALGESGEHIDAAPNGTLFRFAVISDTHFWLPSRARGDWSSRSDAQPERDGLLVSDSDAILQQLLSQLSHFAASGGSFALHAGDAVCGGGSFHQPPTEYERALRAFREQQTVAFGNWPVFHVPGNHDIDPTEGGLAKWRRILGTSGLGNTSDLEVGYRALRVAPGWRLLLLDSMDGVPHDLDGHGHIGEAQLAWLAAQLDESAAASEQVILAMHQLLVSPVDEGVQETELPGWLDWHGDFVDNRAEVLALLARHSHVRLSFHGHVHANTLTTRHGTVFVTNAAGGEYPMHWREVSVHPCEIRIRTRAIEAPALLEKSRLRDTRPNRNHIKRGEQLANGASVRLPWC